MNNFTLFVNRFNCFFCFLLSKQCFSLKNVVQYKSKDEVNKVKRRTSRSTIIFISVLVLTVTACLVCSLFFYQLALINGASMEPAYSGLELVIIDKTAHKLSAGDVVAVKSDAAKGNIIKRIAAVGGDTLQISDGILYVNEAPQDRYGRLEYAGIAADKITIPDGGYFLIGDNTDESRDSRYEQIGIVYDKNIIGRIIPQR